jgi:hypothetical protein
LRKRLFLKQLAQLVLSYRVSNSFLHPGIESDLEFAEPLVQIIGVEEDNTLAGAFRPRHPFQSPD